MVYVLTNQKVVKEDGTIETVNGIGKLVSNHKGLVEVDVITKDMDEFRGTFVGTACKPATIADIVNVLLDEECVSDEVAIEVLSNNFSNLYNDMGDGQEAFDYMMEEDMRGMLDDFDFIYTVTGDNWTVSADGADDSVIEIVNELYGSKAKNLEEACSTVEKQVSKTMSNIGCDPYTALRLEKEDDLPECFVILATSNEAYVEILDI